MIQKDFKMVQPISTTSPIASQKQPNSNPLGQSIDRQYDINPASNKKAKTLTDDELAQAFEQLIKEHLFEEEQKPSIKLEEKEITVKPASKKPSLPLPPKEPSLPPVQTSEPTKIKESKTDRNWSPDIEGLDTQNQQRVISERIIAIKHSAANALTNLKFFLKDLAVNQVSNKAALTSLQQKVTWASKSGGANFELVQSYKQPINMISKYIKLSDQLNTSVEVLTKLLNQIEASMDFIDIDISIGIENFEKSVPTCNIISDFSKALEKLDELSSLLAQAGNPFKKAFSEAENLSKQQKNKIKAIRTYLKGPKSQELIKKLDSEFESEVNLLKDNLSLLTKYIPILKGCLKGKDFLESQLSDVKLFISELNEIHRLFVIGEYQELGKNIPGLCFNGEEIQDITS